MRSKYNKYLLGFAFAIIAVSVFFLSNQSLKTEAEASSLWISIDGRELNQVLADARMRGDNDLQLNVVEVEKGIAVLRADDWQMMQLSSQMHESFHKCSGFIAHESKEAAIAAINAAAAVDPNVSFVNYTIDNQTSVDQLLVEARELSIRQTIMDLSNLPNRRYNQPSGLQSANYIKDAWTALAQDRSDISVEFYNHPPNISPQPSIIMTIQGTTFPSEEIVLGAHQDSINRNGQTLNAPGADDDASGIASLTETIRVLIAKDFRPARTVKFMAYAAEEVGLRGSNDIAQDYRNRNVNVIGVFQLDMTAFQGTPSKDIVLISDNTNAAQNQFLTDLITTYQPQLTIGTTACNYGCSDHASWNSRNYPASFPFEATFADYNNTIHTANDTTAQFGDDASHSLKFTKLALSYVGELAKGAISPNAPNKTRADFDGDGKTDISVFRADGGIWYLLESGSNNSFRAVQWGTSGDLIAPADYDNDGKTDVAVFRAGTWYILNSSNDTMKVFQFGNASDKPVPADYDGDGFADIAVYRASDGTWYQQKSRDGFAAVQFGAAEDVPVVGDYDDDGKADIAVFRSSNSVWYRLNSLTNSVAADQFGQTGDKPIVGDFDGDQKSDLAVYRPLEGIWYVMQSRDGFKALQFGAAEDVPVAGDYDKDGKTDFAVWRASSGTWYLQQSQAGFAALQFGTNGDKPVPAAYNP